MSKSPCVILGVDPGLAATGWGVIVQRGKRKWKAEAWGVVRTSPSSSMPERLAKIHREVKRIIKDHHPRIVAVEEVFFGKNAKTAMIIGAVKGVITLSCTQPALSLAGVPPLQIKMAIVGNGRATKAQVQKATKKVLKLKQIPRPNHAADALAVALTVGGHNARQ